MSVEVIAEIGVCHNGSVDTACKLIDAAKEAGCDAAKFQLWDTERVYPRERWDEMKRLELSRADMVSLKGHCDNVGIEFLCTPDEIEDAQFLKEIGVRRIKTSSQDITNVPFLLQVADLGLPMIVSTGACSEIEMGYALGSIIGHQRKSAKASPSLTILHCVSAYPAPIEEMNLSVIAYLRRTYGPNVGLSDHTIGKAAALIALGLGARIFEKHLTLDRGQPGPDHNTSFLPIEMRDYVIYLRDGEVALGDGIKRVMPCEMENRKRYEAFIAPRKEKV